jgi:DNA-binding CsgD family transcriptional regulator
MQEGRDEHLLGRKAELALLLEAIQVAPPGPFAVAVEGEAGIGKTALWTRGCELAHERSYTVLISRPAEMEADLAFTSLSDLFTEVLDRVLPLLPAVQQTAVRAALFVEEVKDGPARGRALSTAVLGMLRSLSGDGPVLVAIDDLQWVDPASARALAFALRRLKDEPIGLLASWRTDGSRGQRNVVEPILSSLPTQRVSLGPLGVDDVDRLLRTRLETGLPRPTLVRLQRSSGGNPLLALEIARSLQDRHSLDAAGIAPIPDRLQPLELIRLREDELSAETREALAAVAVMAEPSWEDIDSVVGFSAAGALAPAMKSGLIRSEGSAIRFTHPLYASALISTVPANELRELHRRISGALTDREQRVRHLALATVGADAEVAAALDAGGATALARGAPEVAADLFGQAAGITPPGHEEDLRRRRIHAAEALFQAGDAARARSLLQEVVVDTPHGPVRADALRRLGRVLYREQSYRTASEAFQEALRQTEGDLVLAARTRGDLARAGLMAGDLSVANSQARAALDLAEGLSDEAALAEALTTVGLAEVMLGRGLPEEVMRRASLIAERAGARGIRVDIDSSMAIALKSVDDLAGARSRLEELHRRALAQGDHGELPVILYHLSELESRVGNWDQAERYADEGHTAALQTGQEPVRAGLLYAKALVEAHRGQSEEAQAHAEEGMMLAEQTGAPLFVIQNLSVLGFIELSRGDVAATDRYLRPLAELVLAGRLREPVLARFLPDEIEALAGLGEIDLARGLLDRLEHQGRALERLWALATAARCRGLLAAVEGDLEGSLQALDEALVHHQRLPYPFALARTLLLKGEVERRAKHRAAARKSLQHAIDLFAGLGATQWVERGRAELARIGGRAPRSGGLTPTEEQVARLVAAGRTNKEVAEAMFMTVKTVDSNLSRIYHKLGVRSRTELSLKITERVPEG